MSPADQWLRFATLARQLTAAVLPRYAHKFSPQRFTLPQLAACVLLKEYRQLDWRGIEALLQSGRQLQQRFDPAPIQLAACVLLKEYRQLDWRGIEVLLQVSPAPRRSLGLA